MMYWQVTMVDKYTGKSNIYMHIWLGGVEGYLQKASFLLSFCKTLLFLKTWQGIKPKCTNNYFLSQILLYENYDEILPSILIQLLEVVHHRGHG